MAVGRYDGELQMFVEEPRKPDMARLGFLRWLVEKGMLEHREAGASSGPLVLQPTEKMSLKTDPKTAARRIIAQGD